MVQLIYGLQKGADEETVIELDLGLRHFHEMINKLINKDYSLISGAGVAGGLGYSFSSFMNAELKPGVDIVFEKLDMDNIAKIVDMIITGEGKIDEQSAMGKVLHGIGKLRIKSKVQVIALDGCVEKGLSLKKMKSLLLFLSQKKQ